MPVEKTMEIVEDPDAEKILEDEDWMANEDNFDDDDLMDEDVLLIDDMDQEDAPIGLPNRRRTPSSSSRPSPAKKKKGPLSPIAIGVSLGQRKLLVGWASSNQKVTRNGPKFQQGLSPGQTQVLSDIEKA
ncbi:hypothetical protein DY000_02018727 [Brassica cretica]|uniref:Uncharacterized protein n=1 Tax=Brassica cretica TaxID=69181 RepID=A0ABQ7CPV0_BRACR|nr:hypothetical protein DY000_02018727 [Brassica cretica]